MADRRVKVNLELDAKGFADGSRQASQATRDLQKAVLDAERATSSTAAKVVDAKRRETDATNKVADAERKLADARKSGDAGSVASAESELASAKLKSEAASKAVASAELEAASAADSLAASKSKLAAETNKAASASEKFDSFLEKNSANMQTVGTALTAFGAGVTAVGVAAAKTGIEYNTLQQTSGAALKTLMGDASAAANQMDRLDDFARTSPFSKSVFIQAQQQLLGFGVEAERVVPILDAVQNAVAATGGSNEDISELVTIIAQVNATGKVTAETLNQMGTRGIDAATIIGEQMGKSGEAIRSEITAGTLDADAAITALTNGMSERFDGAAAGVKDTFEGAMDRVKAAWRDVSAELMTPFVNPDGGGMLIDLANQAADAMRAFQALPDPVKNTVAALGGLAGVAALGAGGLLLIVPRLWDTYQASRELFGVARNLTTQFPKLTGAVKGLGIAGGVAVGVGALVAGSVALHNSLQPLPKTIGEVTNALNGFGESGDIARLDELFDIGNAGGYEQAIHSVADALAALDRDNMMDKFDNFMADMGVNNNVHKAREAFEQLGTALASMEPAEAAEHMNQLRQEAEAAGRTDFSSWESLAELLPDYAAKVMEAANATGEHYSEAQLLEAAMGDLPPAMRDASDSADTLADAFVGVGDEASELDATLDSILDSMFELGRQNRSVADAQGALSEAIRDANEAVKENGHNFDVNTEKGYENVQALHSIATEMETLIEAQARGGASADELAETYRASYDNILELTGGNRELADSIMGIPEGKTIETYMDDFAMGVAVATAAEIEAIPDATNVHVAVSEDGTAGMVQSSVDEITGKEVFMFVTADGTVQTVQQDIMNIDGKDVPVYVGDDGTVYSTQRAIDAIQGKSVDVVANPVTDAAERALNNLARQRTAQVQVEIRTMGQAAVATGGRAPRADPRSVGALPVHRMGGLAGLPKRSYGGKLPHTGLGTDQILGINSKGTPIAWVDDREWIITKRMSDKYDRALAMINQDHPAIQHLAGFASGGRVSQAERLVSTRQTAYDRISGDKENRNAKLAAKERLNAAKAELKAAKEQQKASEKAAKEAAERRKAVAEMRRDMRVDLRRGEIAGAFASGNGMSVVDRMLNMSRDENLGMWSRSLLARTSGNLEAQLLALTSRSDALAESMKSATERRDDLLQVRDRVAGGLSGEWSLGSRFGLDEDLRTAGGLAKSAQWAASRVGAFADKLERLRKKGYPESLIQEIAEMGSVQGSQAADALLKATGSERRALVDAYASLDAASKRAGDQVTRSMYAGGLNAAEGVVRGLEAKQNAVERAFANMAARGEAAFKAALGIKSPSRVMMSAGEDTGMGAILGVQSMIPDAEQAMRDLAQAQQSAYQVDLASSRVPVSAEVARYAASVPAAPVIDYDRLAQAVSTAGFTGTVYMESGALLGEVRMAVKDPAVTRTVSQSLASQQSRDRKGGHVR